MRDNAETVPVAPDITAVLLADLVEAGVDEPIARTLLTLAARAGENMRLTRENERLRKFADRMRYLAGPTSCECGTCWNLRHEVGRLNDDLPHLDGIAP